MKRRICQACGVKTHSSSSWCPYCGSRIYPRIPWIVIILLVAVVLALFIVVILLMSVQVAGIRHRA